MDLISIIVPIYNSEKYLNDCIISIINQTYTNIELLLINDGSTDNSLSICKEYSDKDKRISVINQTNKGVSRARNKGIEHAKGRYITFIDSDDFIKKNYCQKLINSIKKYNVDMVYFGQTRYYENGSTKLVTVRLDDGIYSSDYILKNIVDDGTLSGFLLHSSCAALYKKEIIDKYQINFETSIKHNEDGFFNLIYNLYSTKVFIKQTESIYFYRINLNSTSHRKVDINKKYVTLHQKLKMLKNYYPQYNFKIQLKRRKIHLIVEYSSSASHLSYKNWATQMHKMLKKIEKADFELIKYNELNIQKKSFFRLVKNKKFLTLYLSLKYLRPILKRM